MTDAYDNVVHSISGALAGMVSMAATYPLISISTRIQVARRSSTSNSSKQQQPPAQGMLDDLKQQLREIKAEGGYSNLYAGLESALFGIAITNGVYYFWYEYAKKLFLRSGKLSIGPLESLGAASLAGAATVLITNPIWVVNTRITTGKAKEAVNSPDVSPSSSSQTLDSSNSAASDKVTALSVFRQIIREEGPLSLWQGVWPALVLVSNPAIQYMVFEQVKARLERVRKASGAAGLSHLDFFVLGAISKIVATFITYPYIVMKSRMQLKQRKNSTSSTSTGGPSMIAYLQKIVREEGVGGLYRGVGLKLYQSVLTAAILFGAKEPLTEYTREGVLFMAALITSRLSRVHAINK